MRKVQPTLQRHLLLLQLVPRHPAAVTARQLVERLADRGHEVTARTVERDLVALSQSYSLAADESRKPFAWSWSLKAATLALPGLSDASAAALKLVQQSLGLSLPEVLVKDLDPWFALADSTLRHDGAGRLRSLLAKVRTAATTQPLLPPALNPQVVDALFTALLDDRAIRASYTGRDGKRADLELHPLGVVQRGPVTYVVATAFRYADVRLYALHRLRSIEVLDQPLRRPKDFSLDDYLRSGALGFGEGKRITLEAMFDAGAADHLYETPLASDQKLTVEDNGRVRVRATVLHTSQLEWWLLGFGALVEVLKPVALRRSMAATATAMAQLYGS